MNRFWFFFLLWKLDLADLLLRLHNLTDQVVCHLKFVTCHAISKFVQLLRMQKRGKQFDLMTGYQPDSFRNLVIDWYPVFWPTLGGVYMSLYATPRDHIAEDWGVPRTARERKLGPGPLSYRSKNTCSKVICFRLVRKHFSIPKNICVYKKSSK